MASWLIDGVDGCRQRRTREAQSQTCLLVITAVELIFCDRSMMLLVFGNGVVVASRVYDDDAPLEIVRHFGHGGGRLIASVSVVSW